jgi:hypothetical protein
VDPAKRYVTRELEARWNSALERAADLERRIEDLRTRAAAHPKKTAHAFSSLLANLATAWNSPSADTRTKQRRIHILVQEIIYELDDATSEAVLFCTRAQHRVAPLLEWNMPAKSADLFWSGRVLVWTGRLVGPARGFGGYWYCAKECDHLSK